MGRHARLYLVGFTLFLFIVGLWPFNFSDKNNAVISSSSGVEIARHGTVYTAVPSEKIHGLKRFTIYIDLTTLSNGLSSFEKIFGYLINQREMNFIVGQWKDGMVLHLPDYKRQKEIHFGAETTLNKDERVKLLISYDGVKLFLYQDGKAKKYRETGPLSFSNWSREYPLVVGADAHGRSQWQGTLHEVAIFDRALSPEEVKSLSGLSRLSGLSGREGKEGTSNTQQAARKENPPQSPIGRSAAVASDQWPVTSGKEAYSLQSTANSQKTNKGEIAAHPAGARNDIKSQDNRPLVHYIFSPENTYETEFRGGKALGVRDLGKGDPADLIIPEQFMPYKRSYLAWDPDWMEYRANWLDLAVNILGFVPLGVLLMLALSRVGRSVTCHVSSGGTEKVASGQWTVVRKQTVDSRKSTATRQENPPVSPFMKGGEIVVAVILASVAGFVVSFAIEFIQAYLPSRDSSMRDLVTNGAGTMIGALAAAWYSRKRAIATSA